MIAWLFLADAWAWRLEAAPPVPWTSAPEDVAVVQRSSGPVVLVLDDGALTVLDRTGATVDVTAAGGRSLAFRDQDGDGAEDVFVCGPDGVSWLPWTSTFGAPVSVTTSECAGLAVVGVGGSSGLAVASAGVDLWWDDGAGGFTGPTPSGILLGGTPLLASAGGRLAAADVGDDVVQELDEWGVSSLAAGGGIGGMAVDDGDWVVSLDTGRVRWFSGDDVATSEPSPGPLAVGDVDGDGVDDVVVSYGTSIGVLPGSGAPERDFPTTGGAIRALAIGDLDGDGCAEVAAVDDLPSVVVFDTLECGDAQDRDGDGASPLDGDCDDTDPGVHPGAIERCNGQDDDCDGDADEFGGVSLVTPDAPDEGDELVVYAQVDGCDPGWTWTWSITGYSWITCHTLGAEAHCSTTDDGDVSFEAIATASDGVTIADVSALVTVRNVDPTLLPPDGAWQDGAVYAQVGDGTISGQVYADDPGSADTHVFSVFGGPDGLSVTPSGYLVLDPIEPGSWTATLRVDDDDGGWDEHDLIVDVQAADTGDDWPDPSPGCGDLDFGCSGGGCCGTSALLPLAWLLARRR